MELLRIRRLFDQLDVGSVVVLDELCSGTNPSEGEEIARLVLSLLPELGVQAFVTTHLLQFAARLAQERPIAADRLPPGRARRPGAAHVPLRPGRREDVARAEDRGAPRRHARGAARSGSPPSKASARGAEGSPRSSVACELRGARPREYASSAIVSRASTQRIAREVDVAPGLREQGVGQALAEQARRARRPRRSRVSSGGARARSTSAPIASASRPAMRPVRARAVAARDDERRGEASLGPEVALVDEAHARPPRARGASPTARRARRRRARRGASRSGSSTRRAPCTVTSPPRSAGA